MAEAVFIVGAGGHGRVCAEIAQAAGFRVGGFVDPGRPSGELINGHSVVAADLTALRDIVGTGAAAAFPALGDNDKRWGLLTQARALGFAVPRLIHPFSAISPSCTIGEGTVVMPGVVVNANSRIGEACILNTGCSIDHDNHLDDVVQICPGVHAAGGVRFGRFAFVGTGANLIPGIVVGERAVVGAGASVTRDVPAHGRVGGVPAQPF